MNPDLEARLRRLALNDEPTIETALGAVLADADGSNLDSKTLALSRVAALVASESALSSYQWAIDHALAVGATDDDIVDVLTAVAPVIGLARLASAVPKLALALGYDIDVVTSP
jgi:alkylhydroperoxidase/carboxymuconolactone decarboxylase family protein YurZ